MPRLWRALSGWCCASRGASKPAGKWWRIRFRAWPFPNGSYAYVDGSGLSRQNLLSADLLIRIFRSMYRNRYFNVFL